MPTGMRGSSEFFKERFALGDRLAVRLAALLAHQVDVTAAAIECLKDSEALRHAILHPELLERAAELDTEMLRALVLPGESLPAQLVVVEHEGWRTIALEEELLAEQGADEEAGEQHLPMLGGKAAVMHPSEIADLFTRRDIAELELVLRTSADPSEKIEALRKLALSPASEREKLALFAMALTDRDAGVRSEAAEALTTLGLAPEVAEDARALAEGNDRQKRFAAQRLGSRIRDAADPDAAPDAGLEMGVLLRIIAGTLRYEPDFGLRRLLIRAVEGACKTVAEDPRSTRDLVRVLAAQLRDAAEELGGEVRRVLLITGRFSPEPVYRILQDELAPIADHTTRGLLIAVAGELAQTDEQRAQTCGQAIAEIVASADPAVECLPLTNLLSGLGDAAIDAIEPHLITAPEPAQETFVRLLDVVATRPGATDAARARIGALMLLALRDGARAARLAVIQSTALMGAAIPEETRRGLAAELLACLQEYANPGIVDAIETTVVRLGAPAVGPALAVLTGEGRPRVRAGAARILGQLVPRLDAGRGALAADAIDTAIDLIDREFPDRPVLVRTVGRMCAGPAADAATVARAADELRRRVVDRPVTNAALEGLASLCLSPRAAPRLKVDLVSFFRLLLERDLPEIEAEALEDRDEVVYALGGGVTAYTELVPSVIAGLRNIALSSTGPLRQQALDALLDTWRQIAGGDLQLGPGNTERLLHAFRGLGTLANIADGQREAIADAVALRRDFPPVYRVLAALCVSAGAAMTDRAVALANELLRRDADDKALTDQERARLLDDLATLVTEADLGGQADRLRRRAVGAVLDADKRDNEHVEHVLRRLAGADAIPADLRKRLATRIQSAT